jgi:hypothetical protein
MAYFREILAATTSSLNAPGGGTADAQAFFGTILSTFATLMGLIGIFAVYAHQRAHDERGEDTARTMRRLRNYLIGLSVTKEEVDRLIPPDLTPTEALALIQSSTGRFFDVAKSHLKKLPQAEVQNHATEAEPTWESFKTSLERIGYSDQTVGSASRLAGWSLGLNGFIAVVALLGMQLAPSLSSRGWVASSEWAVTAAGLLVLIWDIAAGVRIVTSMGGGVVKSALKP